MVECLKKHIILIAAVSAAVIVVVIIVSVVATRNKGGDGKGGGEPEQNILTVIKNNTELKRPNVNLDAEMELVKMENGMTGLIISDPYASKFRIQFTMNYGGYIDTISGISHLGELMVLQSSNKYNTLYPLSNAFGGIKNSELNAETLGTSQSYYIDLPFNLEYEKAMDMLTEAFRHPLYSPELIKNEIQAINHEFYENINNEHLELDLIRLLSNNKTSFNGILCGNKETLNTSDSENLSKKLKGYHMVIKNPSKIFFTLYSDKTMKESEEIAKKYLNYKMHIFPDSEIDEEDKKKLEQNMKDIENIEIFNENLYKHGIYYNTISKKNKLNIYYYLGKIENSKLHFDFIEYLDYLFNSIPLMKVLRDNNYIIMDDYIIVGGNSHLDNNTYFTLSLVLTEKGFNNINDVLVIINRYIDIIKKEGYFEDYFKDFVRYINNKAIIKFNKKNFISNDSFIKLATRLKYCEQDELLFYGKLTENDYNKELLKNHLELIDGKKSFYDINSNKAIKDLNLTQILKNPQTQKLKYYNADYIIGEIPEDIIAKFNDTSIIIKDLEIRDISPYFSYKYNDSVTPCYKEKENKCKEKNEFDYNNEDKYNAIQLGVNSSFITRYQIDKSSESNLVYSNIKIQFRYLNHILADPVFMIELFYMKNLFMELFEIEGFLSDNYGDYNMVLDYNFRTFSDNTEKILKKFVDIIAASPSEEYFKYSKMLTLEDLKEKKDLDFQTQVLYILYKFKKEVRELNYIDELIREVDKVTFSNFSEVHSLLIKGNIEKINFNIAGNINKELAENMHSYIKEKLPIKNIRHLLEEPSMKDNDSPSVVNYYQKSTVNDPKSAIVVDYEFHEDNTSYIQIFKACFQVIAFNYLRFNNTNTKEPYIVIDRNHLIILEMGLYKEVDAMEDDINQILFDVINKKINVNNYKEILESFTTQKKAKREKSLDNLFEEMKNETDTTNSDNFTPPQTFNELVDIVAPIFKQPKRITILIARNTLSDDEFNAMYLRRSKIEKYKLNENINITHTKNMTLNQKN